MKTERCEALIERDKKVISPCSHLSYFPLAVKAAKGSIIIDEDGNQFIDFLSSASSLNLGSTNPVITKAIREQLDEFTQYTPAYCYNDKTTSYAERLVSVYPGGIDAKVCFGNCGSDGNDAAIKFSRAYTGRQKIVTFINGYHGSTYGSATLTTCTTRMKERMGPFLPVNEIAAVIIEPVQGDGGLLPAHPIFMKKLYELCQENGILFISEEVQQGFWRTGKMFAIENYDIIPDGIIMGKSIGASLTLGAFMGRSEIMDCLPAPAHLFTMGGNSVACAAGLAAMDIYYSDEFQALLKNNIDLLKTRAAQLKEKHPNTIAFVRQLGMSMGLGVVGPDGQPDLDGTFKILFNSYQHGLLIISVAGNVLRVQPPLNIEPELINRAFDILEASVTDYENGAIGDDVLRYKAGW